MCFFAADRLTLIFSNILWKKSEFFFTTHASESTKLWIFLCLTLKKNTKTLWKSLKNSEFLFSIWVWPPCKAVTRQKLESGILRGYGANNRYKCASNNPFKTFFLIFRKSLFWPSFQTEICWKTLPSAASRQ